MQNPLTLVMVGLALFLVVAHLRDQNSTALASVVSTLKGVTGNNPPFKQVYEFVSTNKTQVLAFSSMLVPVSLKYQSNYFVSYLVGALFIAFFLPLQPLSTYVSASIVAFFYLSQRLQTNRRFVAFLGIVVIFMLVYT